jgi:hypothetical protein
MTTTATRAPLLHSAYDRALAHSLGVDACGLIRARLWQSGIGPGQLGAHLDRLGAACMPGSPLPHHQPLRIPEPVAAVVYRPTYGPRRLLGALLVGAGYGVLMVWLVVR